jgi:hypothetical protein
VAASRFQNPWPNLGFIPADTLATNHPIGITRKFDPSPNFFQAFIWGIVLYQWVRGGKAWNRVFLVVNGLKVRTTGSQKTPDLHPITNSIFQKLFVAAFCETAARCRRRTPLNGTAFRSLQCLAWR